MTEAIRLIQQLEQPPAPESLTIEEIKQHIENHKAFLIENAREVPIDEHQELLDRLYSSIELLAETEADREQLTDWLCQKFADLFEEIVGAAMEQLQQETAELNAFAEEQKAMLLSQKEEIEKEIEKEERRKNPLPLYGPWQTFMLRLFVGIGIAFVLSPGGGAALFFFVGVPLLTLWFFNSLFLRIWGDS